MSQRSIRFLAAFLCAALVSGCAQMTTVTRQRNLGQSPFLLIDAKQRAISRSNAINCAEPSPDALSALAASQGANLSTPKGASAAESFAIAEAAGSIGLRTQSIQLLRDSMFRVCEAYQNQQLTPFMVELLHQRFQTTMVSVLAIEQLTGAVKAPAVVLGGSSSYGNADAIVQLSKDRQTQAAAVTDAQKDLDSKTSDADKAAQDVAAKKAALDTANAGSDDQAKAAAQKALEQSQEKSDAADKAKSAAEETLKTNEDGLAALDRALTLAQATGSASSNGTIGTLAAQPASTEAIANAVKDIVDGTYKLGHTSDFCTALLADAARKQTDIDVKSPIVGRCVDILAKGQLMIEAQ